MPRGRHGADAATVADLHATFAGCRACRRLVAWREQVGTVERRAFRDWTCWAKPVPGGGPADARVAIVGLAPAAHGDNHTGRIFTGDPAGDALHAVGLASQPTATHRADGLTLHGVRITVPVHCAPPGNSTSERDTCRPSPAGELALLQPPRGWSWRRAGAAGRQRCRCSPRPGGRYPGPGPRPATASTSDYPTPTPVARCICSAVTPQPAQPVHPHPAPPACCTTCCATPPTSPASKHSSAARPASSTPTNSAATGLHAVSAPKTATPTVPRARVWRNAAIPETPTTARRCGFLVLAPGSAATDW